MNRRELGPAAAPSCRITAGAATLLLSSSKRAAVFALQESKAVLIKKTMAVERENNARTTRDHFFFCIIHALLACFAMEQLISFSDGFLDDCEV